MFKSNLLYQKTTQLFQLEPTEDQEVALKELDTFFTTKGSAIFILNGYAGTGKTFLISKVIQAIKAMQKNAVLLAPTGRSAKIFSLFSKTVAYTIHKYIYYSDEDGQTFQLKENKLKNSFFFVDESSMIGSYSIKQDSSLLDDLVNFCLGGVNNNKLILIGDEAQLPPIGQEESLAISADFLEETYLHPVYQSTLKSITRQSENSSILVNATQLRQNLFNTQFDIKLIKQVDHNQSILINGNEVKERLEDYYGKYNLSDVVVLCRSNKQANIYNQGIRNSILFREDILEAEDLLMVVKNNYSQDKNMMKSMSFIANGDIIKVDKIIGMERKYHFNFIDVLVSFPDYPKQEPFVLKVNASLLNSDIASLSYEQQKELYKQVEQSYMYENSKSKRYMLIKKDPYLQALQVKFSYAITVHKAQGGQWPVAFIERGYLSNNTVDKNYVRWFYTAITRAKEVVCFVNFGEDFLIR